MARGLLTREVVTGDQRAIRLQLTVVGRELLEETTHAMADRLEELVSATDDPAATMRALVTLDDAIDRQLAKRRAAREAT